MMKNQRKKQKEMIYIDFNGRCGDQFFQYAFARKIQLYIENYEPLQFNFFNQKRWRNKLNDPTFKNDLQLFNVIENNSFVSETRNVLVYGSHKQKSLLKRYSFWRRVSQKLNFPYLCTFFHKKLQKNGIFHEDEYFSFLSYPKRGVNVFLRGYFEDFHYFEDEKLKSILKQELTPVEKKVDLDFLKLIKDSESVCVTMRSWKEVSQFKDVINSRFICDKHYFLNAMEKMRKILPNCKFFIFSDDMEFAKGHVDKKFDVLFERDGYSLTEKIILMSSCKHFILSNSSFSWWMQYLSNEGKKVTISPTRWYNDKDDKRIINNNWIKIGD